MKPTRPREGLRDALHQPEVLRTGKHELPRRAAPIDNPLQVGKQLGAALRFRR